MEEAPENSKEFSHSAHASGMNECITIVPGSNFKAQGAISENACAIKDSDGHQINSLRHK